MQLCLAFDNRRHLFSRDRDKNTQREDSKALVAALLLVFSLRTSHAN
jgi:hypothetical protein